MGTTPANVWSNIRFGIDIGVAALGAAYHASKTFYITKVKPFYVKTLRPILMDLACSFLLGMWWAGSAIGSSSSVPKSTVASAFVFMEGGEEDGERYEVTHTIKEIMKVAPTTYWEAPLCSDHDLPTRGWRLEIRYTARNQKYRFVAKPGVTRELPDILADPGPKRFPRIVHATLIDFAEGKTTDITARVLKYLGPRNDFHGTPLRVRDLFPNDYTDDADYAWKGYKVEFVKSDLKKVRYSYEDNTVITI